MGALEGREGGWAGLVRWKTTQAESSGAILNVTDEPNWAQPWSAAAAAPLTGVN